ncbi:MAG: hypothetical protein MUF87_20920 [Anaerolineae bacterium]|nr:hypothetical protein [Anaerolineae bacterium]
MLTGSEKQRKRYDQAIAYLERCVELDELVSHPDLESDRQVLEQIKRERDQHTL